MKVRIGTRQSRLAMVQAEIVMDAIRRWDPSIRLELVAIKTAGDKILDRPLNTIGGKGLFVKELEQALLDGRIDIAVHSMKDVPMDTDYRLPIAAFSRREDPRDVLVLPAGKEMGGLQGPIGCSSLRRRLQIQRLLPEARIEPVRGNVLTRLDKLDRGEYGALILAGAGLKRLGLEGRISRYFSVGEVLPAAGQGTLAVQGRRGEDTQFLRLFHYPDSEKVACAERAFVRELDGGCSSPVAAYGEMIKEEISLLGLYWRPEDNTPFYGRISGEPQRAEEMGRVLSRELKNYAGSGGDPDKVLEISCRENKGADDGENR